MILKNKVERQNLRQQLGCFPVVAHGEMVGELHKRGVQFKSFTEPLANNSLSHGNAIPWRIPPSEMVRSLEESANPGAQGSPSPSLAHYADKLAPNDAMSPSDKPCTVCREPLHCPP